VQSLAESRMSGRRTAKRQAPRSKLQRISKFEAPTRRRWERVSPPSRSRKWQARPEATFGIWRLVLVWSLVLGIWSFLAYGSTGDSNVEVELVKLRYFVGMTLEEAAEVLGMSARTGDNYWAHARAWLFSELKAR